MKEQTKVIAIALEAAEPTLIEKWVKEGKLPIMASFMEKGAWRLLMSSTDVSSGATFASINTGTNPGKHGMGFFHRQIKPGTYTIRKKYANEVARDPFWLQLSNSGKKCAILEIPAIYPLKYFNGIQMMGWGAEGLNWKQASSPKSLLKEIKKRYGTHPLELWYQRRPKTRKDWKSFADTILEGAKIRTRFTKWLIDREPWDFFLIGYPETHWIGHYFWHLTDKNHPDYDAEVDALCHDAIFKIYQEAERGIQTIIENHPESSILIFSNTGMGLNYTGLHLLPEILNRLGYGSQKRQTETSKTLLDHILPSRRWGPYSIKEMEKIFPPKLMETAKRIIPERLWDTMTRSILTMGNDWKDTKAFVLPSDFTSSIRLNLKGREPNGLVDPKDYDPICEALTNDIKQLINPVTGKGAVNKIIKTRDIFHGENLEELPDLIVRWERDAPTHALKSPKIGTVEGELPDKRTGAHAPYGFLLTFGKHFAKKGHLPEANIMDIAPTILYLFRESIAEDIDGKILSDMIADEYQANDPIN